MGQMKKESAFQVYNHTKSGFTLATKRLPLATTFIFPKRVFLPAYALSITLTR